MDTATDYNEIIYIHQRYHKNALKCKGLKSKSTVLLSKFEIIIFKIM